MNVDQRKVLTLCADLRLHQRLLHERLAECEQGDRQAQLLEQAEVPDSVGFNTVGSPAQLVEVSPVLREAHWNHKASRPEVHAQAIIFGGHGHAEFAGAHLSDLLELQHGLYHPNVLWISLEVKHFGLEFAILAFICKHLVEANFQLVGLVHVVGDEKGGNLVFLPHLQGYIDEDLLPLVWPVRG